MKYLESDHVKTDNGWKVAGYESTIPPFNFSIINEPEEALQKLSDMFRDNDYLGMDTETTSLEWEMPETEMHGFSVAGKQEAIYIHGPASVKEDVLTLLEYGLNTEETVWFNFPFDLHVLERYGIKYEWNGKAHDAYVMSRLNNRGDTRGGHSLKANGFLYLGHEDLPDFSKLLVQYGDIHSIPINILGRYGAFDSRLSYDLFIQLRNILKHEKVLGTENKTLYDYYKEEHMKVLEVAYRMEKNGMFIDVPFLKETDKMAREVVEGVGNFWEKATGTLINSPQQKAYFFFDLMGYDVISTTDTGNPSTDSSSLKELVKKEGDVWADLYVNTISPASKILSTYTSPILERVNELGKPYIHGSFSVPKARTGRWSSSNPNLQNIPAHGKWGKRMRQSFSAPPGYKFLRADYSQLELRCLAHFSQDPVWIDTFMEGGDPHELTAETVGVSRDQAKVINFGILYGMQSKSLAQEMRNWGVGDISEREAQQYIDSFMSNFQVTRQWMERVKNYARKVGYVQTILGRKRWLPAISDRNDYDRGRAERKAVNTVIQGSAADIMNRGAIYAMGVVDEYNKSHNHMKLELPIRMADVVHDEIGLYIPETEHMYGIARMVGTALESAGNYVGLRVPLVAEPSLGDSWLEVKE